MTLTKLPRWIAVVLLCLCAFSFSGCSGEQGTAYKKAESVLQADTVSAYKEAAVLFESAGDFTDAAQRARECWRKYGEYRLRHEGDTPQERLAALREAKSVFEHIRGYAPAAKLEAETGAAIATALAWVAVRTEQDNGNNDKAMALLEAMVDVYLTTGDIRVVDLVTRKTLATDKITNDAAHTYSVPTSIKQGDIM